MHEAELDAVVIGAGVIGLACGKALAEQGLETLLIERHNSIGQETSSRNSEVIHAGLYYPTASLKAALCVAGKHKLYAYCESHNVPYRRCGKLIVATDHTQLAKLEALQVQARANGVDDIRLLTRSEALQLEPQLSCHAALLSPSTGIIDSHTLMLALQGDFERAGGSVALQSHFQEGHIEGDKITLFVRSGNETTRLRCHTLINASGLGACTTAQHLHGMPAAHIPTPYLARGNYFALTGQSPFNHLVYPIPEPGGLGVHLTLDLAGQARFGPDVEWIPHIDYNTPANRADSFYAQIRKYWQALPDNSLTPAYSGIRPKISGPGEANADFVIQGPEAHGVPGLVNLFGIESPGLTASLAIADAVANKLGLNA